MTAWPFIVFALIFAALVCLHFVLAYRAWRVSRGEPAEDIDPKYVRVEDYFARSFRLKVAEWLKLPVESAGPDGSRVIMKGRERIRISGKMEYPPRTSSDDILVSHGPFRCLAGCTFNREIYAREDAVIGAGCQLQAVAVDGSLTLGANVRVARWVDSVGDLEIGPDSIVGSRATAGRTIHLQNGAQVVSAFAARVSTCLPQSAAAGECKDPEMPELQLPGSGLRAGAVTNGKGIDRKKLNRLSPECWFYNGDLKSAVPLRLTVKLIVKGDCLLAAGSVLEADLKADGRIEIGERSVCKGNVIARGAITFRRFSRFQGIAHAGGSMRLCRGVRGGDPGSKVAAFSSEALMVEEDVLVHGKLASGDRVMVMASSGDGGRRGGLRSRGLGIGG